MKVGEYVRYKRPFERKETIMIGKIIRIYEPDEKHKIKGYDLDTCDVISDEFSIKSSSNIIDLIEVGDYVNGSMVVRIEEHDEKLYVYVQETQYCYACDEEENIYYKEDTIKSIVTKEMYSSVEYRVESH